MEKPTPLLPFIGSIKNSSEPKGKGSHSMSQMQSRRDVYLGDLVQLSPSTVQTKYLTIIFWTRIIWVTNCNKIILAGR